MGVSQDPSSLQCEVRIIRARNLEYISNGNLFVRFYLCNGDNGRIQLNSREVSSRCVPYWNESTVLECVGAEDAMDKVKQQTIIFELRWRKNKYGRSKILLRSEIGWKDVFNATELSIEKWVTPTTQSKYVPEGLKPPALLIEMKVRYSDLEKTKQMRSCQWKECGCRDGACNGRDEDIFSLAATLQVL